MQAKFLFFTLFFLGQVFLSAQEKTPRFRLELSNQSIFTKGHVLNISGNVDFLVNEKSYNYASHFSGFWRLGNRLELGLGLGYAVRDAHVFGAFCPFNISCSRTGGLLGFRYTRIRSLEIPLEWRWKYVKSAKKIIPYFAFGIANRIPILNTSIYADEKAKWMPAEYAMGAILGAGLQIEVFEEWSILLTAQIRKDSNYKFQKRVYFDSIVFLPIIRVEREVFENRWFNEAAIKISLGRTF